MGRKQPTEEGDIEAILAADQQPRSALEEALAQLKELNTQWLDERNYQQEVNSLYKVSAYDWMLDVLQRSLKAIANSRTLHVDADARYRANAYEHVYTLLTFTKVYAAEVSESKKWAAEYVQTIQTLTLALALGMDEFKLS